MAANSSVGFVLICTEDTNTTRTLVNCSSGLCNEAIFDGTEQVIEIICDPKGVNITMNIYAINDCDELSDVLTRTIHLECVGMFPKLVHHTSPALVAIHSKHFAM